MISIYPFIPDKASVTSEIRKILPKEIKLIHIAKNIKYNKKPNINNPNEMYIIIKKKTLSHCINNCMLFELKRRLMKYNGTKATKIPIGKIVHADIFSI